ncbi:MAG: hypothetical protein GY865_03805 [candidate division Zixibacteria bacterium]|nr:hypothetical protein [candidate division Zixibacteria bacterium]
MLNKLKTLLVVLLIVSLCLAGCARQYAPHGWLSDVETTEVQAFGSWIELNYVTDSVSGVYQGELIAIDSIKVYILTSNDLIDIDRAKVSKAIIVSYDAHTGKLAGWVAVGSVLTASHGVLMIGTLPAWLLLGSMIAAGHSYMPLSGYPSTDWDELKKFARFPYGLPEGLSYSDLKQKYRL